MTQKGEAGRALGISITSGFLGGIISFGCLFLIAALLADVALQFRAADLFSLVLFGLTVICSFASKPMIKGLLSAALGLLIVTMGQDLVMGMARFTFGNADLLAGIHFLTALIGLFAIPQLISNFGPAKAAAAGAASKFGSVLPHIADLVRIKFAVLIGSFCGTFLGILPGAGGPIAAFISYDYAKKVSKKTEEFGQGSIEGVSAPESANNAVAGGALTPMMTLGIPGDPVTAILIGALLIHGLTPGPLLFLERGDFAYAVIFSYFWANIFNLAIALVAIRFLVKLLLVTHRVLLMPCIALLCVIGSYSLRNSFFDVYIMFLFGLIGLSMRWLNMPAVPMLLALVLGPQLEEHLRVALTGSRGDVSVFFTSSFSAGFLVLSFLSVAWSIWFERRQKTVSDSATTTTSIPEKKKYDKRDNTFIQNARPCQNYRESRRSQPSAGQRHAWACTRHDPF